MPATLEAEVARLIELHAPSAGDLPERLAGAAIGGLADVLAGSGGRESAGTLLAADALLTYACEAAAEAGPDAIDRLTRSLRPARFQAMLNGSDASE